MDNNEKKVKQDSNHDEKLPEWNINREDMGLPPLENNAKIDWKTTVKKHLQDNSLTLPIEKDEDNAPWMITREDMGIAPLTSETFGHGGTSFSEALSEVLKNHPALNEHTSMTYITDGQVIHDKLSPEDKEYLANQQKNTIENLLKDPNASVTHYSLDDFTKTNTGNSNDILNKVVENVSFPKFPDLSGLEKFRFTEDSVKQHSLDYLAHKIKKVNLNLNPSEEPEDNKPKLK